MPAAYALLLDVSQQVIILHLYPGRRGVMSDVRTAPTSHPSPGIDCPLKGKGKMIEMMLRSWKEWKFPFGCINNTSIADLNLGRDFQKHPSDFGTQVPLTSMGLLRLSHLGTMRLELLRKGLLKIPPFVWKWAIPAAPYLPLTSQVSSYLFILIQTHSNYLRKQHKREKFSPGIPTLS